MLYTIAVVLIILWLLGLVTGYTIGSFIHFLLVVAVIMILVNLISGRKAFQKSMKQGIEILNTIQDVYLCKEIGLA